MNDKIKMIILFFVIIIIIFLLFCFRISKIDKFEPFTKNNILTKYDVSFRIEKELPKIEAASAFYPFAANLVQNIYNEENYTKEILNMVSTSQAYEDLINNRTDIIISTEPSDEQKEMIKNAELEFNVLYLEPLAILVNSKNDITNLELDQIKEIYYGNSSNWNTYQLEKNNGSQTCFESIVKNNVIEKNHFEIKTMPKIIDEIASDKKGIGYAFYSYYSKMHKNENAKMIKINDKEVNDSNYPLLFEVYYIYRTDNKNENTNRIMEWIKTKEGQDLIKIIK